MYSFREITDRERWDAFVDRCDPNTFIASWAWSEVEHDLGRDVRRLGLFRDDTQIGIFLAFVTKTRRGNILISPHGPILAKDAGISLHDVLPIVRDELKQIGTAAHCVCVRMCPLIPPIEENRRMFADAGFRPAPIHLYSEIAWVLDITRSEETLLQSMKKNTRYGIRKAEKDGVTVWSSTDLVDAEVFWDLYMKTAARHGFVVYPKSLIEAEFRRFAAHGRARWYFASFQGEVISTALIVYSATTAFYHHGASAHALGSITPGEALQWQIIRDAREMGLRRYNFWGVVPDEAKSHPWAGLSKFKRGFGGYAEAYLHTQDLPLSSKYWLTWTIETVRKWRRKV